METVLFSLSRCSKPTKNLCVLLSYRLIIIPFSRYFCPLKTFYVIIHILPNGDSRLNLRLKTDQLSDISSGRCLLMILRKLYVIFICKTLVIIKKRKLKISVPDYDFEIHYYTTFVKFSYSQKIFSNFKKCFS